MATLLKNSTQIELPGSGQANPLPTFEIKDDELSQLIAKEINFNSDRKKESKVRDPRGDIVTDSMVHAKPGPRRERELQPWVPDPGQEFPLGTFQLDNNYRGKWDQFAVNRDLFGVQSTYDETYYRKKVENPSPELVQKAERIEWELQHESTSNIHLAEERGQMAPEGYEEVDEETRYSSVIRLEDNKAEEPKIEEESLEQEAGSELAVDLPPNAKKSKQKKKNKSKSKPTPDGHEQPVLPPVEFPSSSAVIPPTAPVAEPAVAEPVSDTAVPTKAEEPIDIHNRLSKLKVNLHSHPTRAIGRGPSGSPYHSPMSRNSPSHLNSDLNALNLDHSQPQVGENVWEEFVEFKHSLRHKKKEGKDETIQALKTSEPKSPAMSTKQEGQSSSSNTNSPFISPSHTPRRSALSSTKSDALKMQHEMSSLSRISPLQPEGDKDKESAKDPPADPQEINPEQNEASDGNNGAGSESIQDPASKVAEEPSKPVKKFTLNPDAKEFKFNPKAKSFVPGMPKPPLQQALSAQIPPFMPLGGGVEPYMPRHQMPGAFMGPMMAIPPMPVQGFGHVRVPMPMRPFPPPDQMGPNQQGMFFAPPMHGPQFAPMPHMIHGPPMVHGQEVGHPSHHGGPMPPFLGHNGAPRGNHTQ